MAWLQRIGREIQDKLNWELHVDGHIQSSSMQGLEKNIAPVPEVVGDLCVEVAATRHPSQPFHALAWLAIAGRKILATH